MAFSLRRALTRPSFQKAASGWQQTTPFADWRSRARAREALEERRETQTAAGDDFLTLIEWCKRYRVIRGTPFSLDRFKPLKDIYEDDHPFQVYQKPAQAGLSEFAICLVIYAMVMGYLKWAPGQPGLTVGYLFPTQAALSDFSKQRFSGLKRESDYLAALVADSEFDDVGFKQIKDSYLYLRGAASEDGLQSFPADILVLDEYDRMSEKAVEQVRKRMRQSLVKREVCISTPTQPEAGVNKLYLSSDQQVWEVPCNQCGEYIELDYWRDVRANGKAYQEWKRLTREEIAAASWAVYCPACKRPMDRFADGRWVARRPEVKTIRGRQIPALCFPAITLEELARDAISKDPTVLTQFYNLALGLPYTAGGTRITTEMLNKLFAELPNGELPETKHWLAVTMGVDVNGLYNYWIEGTSDAGLRCVLDAGVVESWEQVDGLMRQYKVVSCVVDKAPELHSAKEFANRWKGRVKRGYYPELPLNEMFAVGAAPKTPKSDSRKRAEKQIGKLTAEEDEPDVVRINRTMACDAVYARVAELKIAMPEHLVLDEEIRKQLCAPGRVLEKNKHGDQVASWQHTTPDDYFHAQLYCMIARAIMPRQMPGTLVHGRTKGWSPK